MVKNVNCYSTKIIKLNINYSINFILVKMDLKMKWTSCGRTLLTLVLFLEIVNFVNSADLSESKSFLLF